MECKAKLILLSLGPIGTTDRDDIIELGNDDARLAVGIAASLADMKKAKSKPLLLEPMEMPDCDDIVGLYGDEAHLAAGITASLANVKKAKSKPLLSEPFEITDCDDIVELYGDEARLAAVTAASVANTKKDRQRPSTSIPILIDGDDDVEELYGDDARLAAAIAASVANANKHKRKPSASVLMVPTSEDIGGQLARHSVLGPIPTTGSNNGASKERTDTLNPGPASNTATPYQDTYKLSLPMETTETFPHEGIPLSYDRLSNTSVTAEDVMDDVLVVCPRLALFQQDINLLVQQGQQQQWPKVLLPRYVPGEWPTLDSKLDLHWEEDVKNEPKVTAAHPRLRMDKEYLIKPFGSIDTPMILMSSYPTLSTTAYQKYGCVHDMPSVDG